MQTWIDGYIVDLGIMARKDSPNSILTSDIIEIAEGGFSRYGKYEGKPFRKIPNFVLGRLLMSITSQIPPEKFTDGESIFFKLDQIVSTFVTPSEQHEVSAIKLNNELAKTFVDAKAPKVSKRDLKIDVDSIRYIDVPLRTIPVKNDFIRSIFVITLGTVSKVACIFNDEEGTDIRVFTFEFGDVLAKISAVCPEDQATAEEMQIKVENFITLSLLYHQVAIAGDSQPLPKVSPADVTKLSVKKANAKHQKCSIFDVHYLKAPKGHFGMRRNHKTFTTSGSWDVRGHFRWQACGIGKMERKLIWIDGYIKGTGEKHQRIDILT